MMFQSLPIFIGFRYLRGRSGDRFGRFVSFMSTAGITIGVMSLITVLSVMNGFEAQLKQRMLGVIPHASITGVYHDSEQTNHIADWQGVLNVAPMLSSDGIIQSPLSLSAGHLIGIDPTYLEPIRRYLQIGSIDVLLPHSYKIVLGRKMARDLGVTVGDKIRVMVTSASQFTPIGRIPSQRNFTVAGVYDTGTDIDGQLMYINIKDLSRLMRLNPNESGDLRLFLSDPFNVISFENKAQDEQLDWSDWRVLRGEFFQAVRMEKNIMGLMLGLIILVAGFNIITALIMVVMEKQSEIAILKTQGMTPQQIVTIFMVQGASSGVIGALLGGVLGTFLASYVNEIIRLLNISVISQGIHLPVVIEPSSIVGIVFAAIILSLVATLFPALRAASVQPAEVLRYE